MTVEEARKILWEELEKYRTKHHHAVGRGDAAAVRNLSRKIEAYITILTCKQIVK